MASRKISNFPANTSIPSGSEFTFISNDVNYRITIDNLETALGVTGTIVQDGAITGTPVLDTQGSVNNIRNIENGSGVTASVSPENGVTIEHNFTQDAVGTAIVSDLTSLSPTFRSLTGGSGITLTVNGDNIDISQDVGGVIAENVSIVDTGNKYTSDNVEGALQEAATELELASQANGKGASLVGVEDSAGNFTGSNTEAVLAELAGFILADEQYGCIRAESSVDTSGTWVQNQWYVVSNAAGPLGGLSTTASLGMTLAWNENNASSGVTANLTDGYLELADTGTYQIVSVVCFATASTQTIGYEFTFGVSIDGGATIVDFGAAARGTRSTTNSGVIGSATFTCMPPITTANTRLYLLARRTTATSLNAAWDLDFTNFTVHKVGR